MIIDGVLRPLLSIETERTYTQRMAMAKTIAMDRPTPDGRQTPVHYVRTKLITPVTTAPIFIAVSLFGVIFFFVIIFMSIFRMPTFV